MSQIRRHDKLQSKGRNDYVGWKMMHVLGSWDIHDVVCQTLSIFLYVSSRRKSFITHATVNTVDAMCVDGCLSPMFVLSIVRSCHSLWIIDARRQSVQILRSLWKICCPHRQSSKIPLSTCSQTVTIKLLMSGCLSKFGQFVVHAT